VVCPAYRLAPEHPFPAALRDARAVLTALHEAGEARIILSGDSAGGGLAASLASLARDDLRPPVGLILLSAWLDLTVSAPAYDVHAMTDPLFSRAAATEAAALYLQGMPADDSLASPLRGDASGYPPSFVSAGAGEVLIDDARAFAARLEAAGVAAWLDVVPGMEHVAVTRDPGLPGAADTFAAICGFVDSLA
jgi:epsilon-lactone hydrolase